MDGDEKIPVSLANESQSSQLKDEKRSEGEMVVKKLFVNDMIDNNHLSSIIPGKEATCYAVPWDSSQISVVPSTLGAMAIDTSVFDLRVLPLGTMSVNTNTIDSDIPIVDVYGNLVKKRQKIESGTDRTRVTASGWFFSKGNGMNKTLTDSEPTDSKLYLSSYTDQDAVFEIYEYLERLPPHSVVHANSTTNTPRADTCQSFYGIQPITKAGVLIINKDEGFKDWEDRKSPQSSAVLSGSNLPKNQMSLVPSKDPISTVQSLCPLALPATEYWTKFAVQSVKYSVGLSLSWVAVPIVQISRLLYYIIVLDAALHTELLSCPQFSSAIGKHEIVILNQKKVLLEPFPKQLAGDRIYGKNEKPYFQIRENNWTLSADINGGWSVKYDLGECAGWDDIKDK
eukprot:Gb_25559 [translate_table: standard]